MKVTTQKQQQVLERYNCYPLLVQEYMEAAISGLSIELEEIYIPQLDILAAYYNILVQSIIKLNEDGVFEENAKGGTKRSESFDVFCRTSAAIQKILNGLGQERSSKIKLEKITTGTSTESTEQLIEALIS